MITRALNYFDVRLHDLVMSVSQPARGDVGLTTWEGHVRAPPYRGHGLCLTVDPRQFSAAVVVCSMIDVLLEHFCHTLCLVSLYQNQGAAASVE